MARIIDDMKEFVRTNTRKNKQKGFKRFAREMGYKIPKKKKKKKKKSKKKTFVIKVKE